jgi:hypothetical protein
MRVTVDHFDPKRTTTMDGSKRVKSSADLEIVAKQK